MPERTFEREVLDRLILIESKLDGYATLKDTVYTTKEDVTELKAISSQHEADIKHLQDNNKWMLRAVITALLGLIASVITTFIK